ncbi:M2 family metallopeptidase [Psychrosphaera sp. 1_MG-2023]|uniref:M2 family metallopeptidase n=1 Tax=Psychrosphaera sp. 1_MG-2023 TaxID=3062643 RepID=UPI0026E1B94D|nr:M2 family metallopeptidase [Psychrosphaera sp. 1_MG-2023]MDO6720138.1 M2 family metallopeptidase [Psychrosphaera sp. 1_MG-2023]
MFKLKPSSLLICGAMALSLSACTGAKNDTSNSTEQTVTASDAKLYVANAEKRIKENSEYVGKALWISQTFITEDSQYIASKANEEYKLMQIDLANGAAKFKDLDLDIDTKRKLDLLRLGLTLPAPASKPELASELAGIESELGAMYGSGQTPDGEKFNLVELSQMLATSDDPQQMLEGWINWRKVSPQMKPKYERLVEIANLGAKDLGFDDVGSMWRSNYDMSPEEFEQEMDRVWLQVKPLYDSLHCHVRAKLNEKYGDDVVPAQGPIPAHMMGNMWAQTWGNLYDAIGPKSNASVDVTKQLKEHNYDAIKMVEQAEGFFTSLGFEPLPESFWEKSMFNQPTDHDAVCHASAWDITPTDYRIKMCIQTTGEEFNVIHHELGHNFYQRAYNLKQPVLYRNSANDGFHEAIGDTVALSITPKYLKEIDLIDEEPDASGDLPFLIRMAMDKVAFLPFGLMVDKWRWQVFSGELSPEQYNDGWWKLREQYQGIVAPVARAATDFDPGSKYHIPANTPYSRYFLAHILQFQFHRELCEIAGETGPLHRCSIYGSKEAGAKLNAMLEMGTSKTWQEALEAMTGSGKMDATAVLDYFKPVQEWLDKQNMHRQCGW